MQVAVHRQRVSETRKSKRPKFVSGLRYTGEEEFSAVALSKRQARVYSVRSAKGKLQRHKSKLRNVVCLNLSENGKFAVIAQDQKIKVLDLTSPQHPCVASIPFPESLVASDKVSKGLAVPAPHFLHVSNNGQWILSQSKSRGAIWMYGRHEVDPTAKKTWKVFLPQGGLAASILARFLRERHPMAAYVARVYSRTEKDQSVVGFSFQQAEWSGSAYTVQKGLVHSMTFPHDSASSSTAENEYLSTVVQAWSARRGAAALNFASSSPLAPIVVLFDPHYMNATQCRLGDAMRASSTEILHICSMAWTQDGLFLGVAWSNGSLTIVSSSGEPVHMLSVGAKGIGNRPTIAIRLSLNDVADEHFALASHQVSPEFVWCDGSSNFVKVSLPTASLVIQRHESTVPQVAMAFSMVVDVLLASQDALKHSKHLPDLGPYFGGETLQTQRCLLAWATCVAAPFGWTSIERDKARECAQAMVGSIFHDLSRDELKLVRVVLHIFAISAQTFRLQQELCFLVRCILQACLRQGFFYAALHILRAAESHFHKIAMETETQLTGKYSSHLSLACDALFQRHWLVLGTEAARTSLSMVTKEVGHAMLGYAQQRVSTWSKARQSVAFAMGRVIQLPIAQRSIFPPTCNISSWNGVDLFLRGKYDQAEAAFASDPHSSYHLMCLLLRRYKILEAVNLGQRIAASIGSSEVSKMTGSDRSALQLLGNVLTGTLLNEPSFVATPSPATHPTLRTVRFLHIPQLARVIRGGEDTCFSCAIVSLLLSGRVEVAASIAKEIYLPHGLLMLLRDQHYSTLMPKAIKAVVVQRTIAMTIKTAASDVTLSLAQALCAFEKEEEVRQSALWVCMLGFQKQHVENVPNFAEFVAERTLGKTASNNTVLDMARAVLLLSWSSLPQASWKPLLHNSLYSSDWIPILQLVVLSFWNASTQSKAGQEFSLVLLERLSVARTISGDSRNHIAAFFQQYQEHAEWNAIINVVLRLDEDTAEAVLRRLDFGQDDTEVDKALPSPLVSHQDGDGDSQLTMSSNLLSEPSIGSETSWQVVKPLLMSSDEEDLDRSFSTDEVEDENEDERSESDDEQVSELSSPCSSPSRSSKSSLSSLSANSVASSSSSGSEQASPWIFTSRFTNRKSAKENKTSAPSSAPFPSDQERIFRTNLSLVESKLNRSFKMQLNEAMGTIEQRLANLIERKLTSETWGQKQAQVVVKKEIAQTDLESEQASEWRDEEEQEEETESQNTSNEFSGDSDTELGHISSAVSLFMKNQAKHGILLHQQRKGAAIPRQADQQPSSRSEWANLNKPPPRVPTVPTLLVPNPSSQLIAQQHRVKPTRQAVVSDVSCQADCQVWSHEASAQVNMADKVRPLCSIETQVSPRSPPAPAALDENRAVQVREKDVQTDSASPMAQAYRRTEGSGLILKEANQTQIAIDERKPRFVPVDMSQVGVEPKIPVVFPPSLPMVYLNIQADGFVRMSQLTQNQDGMRNYIHVADLDGKVSSSHQLGGQSRVVTQRKSRRITYVGTL